MGHLFVLLLIISGGAGLIALSVYYLYSFFNPSESLSAFLGLQGFVVFIVFLNAFHAYNLSDLGAIPTLQVLSYCLSLVWAPGFLYFTALFYMNISKQEIGPALRRILFSLAIIVGALSFFPLALSRDLGSILTMQKWIQRHLIVPCCGFTQVGFSVFFYIKARSRSYRNHKIMSLSAMILNSAIAIACALAVDLTPVPRVTSMETYLVVLDYYFLSWNLLALAVFFGLSPLIRKKRKELLKARLASENPSTDAAMDRDWRIVEAAVVGRGLFRKTGLDLSMLSRETRIPRNRISLVVKSVTGRSFNDYINSTRIAEFKRIASSPGFSGNILMAAFDAGFNSKATFYNWIKKDLNESPGEYIRRLRSDSPPSAIKGGA
jgi:AraC-like DNA-binding protein